METTHREAEKEGKTVTPEMRMQVRLPSEAWKEEMLPDMRALGRTGMPTDPLLDADSRVLSHLR